MPKGTPYIQPAQKDSWETTKDLFDALWEEADGFDMDPCCTPEPYTAKRVLTAGVGPVIEAAVAEVKEEVHG